MKNFIAILACIAGIIICGSADATQRQRQRNRQKQVVVVERVVVNNHHQAQRQRQKQKQRVIVVEEVNNDHCDHCNNVGAVRVQAGRTFIRVR